MKNIHLYDNFDRFKPMLKGGHFSNTTYNPSSIKAHVSAEFKAEFKT